MFTETVRRGLNRIGGWIRRALPHGTHDYAEQSERPQMTRSLYRGPALDIEETDDAMVVRAELPGLTPDDVSIEVSGHRLIIRGEKREQREENRRGFYVVERRYGRFERSIPLPYQTDADRAETDFKDGVLSLKLPKVDSNVPRRIPVRVRG